MAGIDLGAGRKHQSPQQSRPVHGVGFEDRCGSDSESLAASKSSPLVLKEPTYAMIPQKDRVGS
jgi:hypothetical protein